MLRRLVAFFACLFVWGASASANELLSIEKAAFTIFSVAGTAGGGGGGSVPFIALHTYYIATTSASPPGNDSNPGTLAAPWATPNHAVVCGDVIVAAAGNYPSWGSWGTVSGCPSNTGGIDGGGGVYFATMLCASTLHSCTGAGVKVAASNWAVEGFWETASSGFCYLADGTASGTTQYAFIAFINDIANTCEDGFTTGDGGHNHNVPGNGIDEFAVVGDIAYQANADPICVGAIDDPGPSASQSFAGTHVYYYGSFALSNLQQNGCGGHDGEGFFWDTADAHGYTGQSVMENNIAVQSALFGFSIFTQTYNSITGMNYYMVNNTAFSNNADTVNGQLDGYSSVGDFNIQMGNLPTGTFIYNNISAAGYASVGGITGSFNGYVSGSTLTVSNSLVGTILKGQGLYCASGCTGEPYITAGSGSSWTLDFSLGTIGSSGSPVAFFTQGGPVTALAIGGTYGTKTGNVSPNPSNSQNVIYGLINSGGPTYQNSCSGIYCQPGSGNYWASTFASSVGELGTNTYINPAFSNTTDLLANQVGSPTCSGYANVTACMGYNANTGALTSLSVIGDLVPSATGTLGKGYQLPSTTCAADAFYPTWLKGIVYLQWNGASITENAGLVTKPCNL